MNGKVKSCLNMNGYTLRLNFLTQNCLFCDEVLGLSLNPIAPRTAKTPLSFCLPECNLGLREIDKLLGNQLYYFIFVSFLNRGQLLKKRICSAGTRVDPILEIEQKITKVVFH